ncbi:hypothetical protein CN150_27905 [Sinorhizobium meliloti]|uniref:hypothetical protein n=1 Tax=Rhizobium meliloti TaxID=382 RepID=UPI000FE09D96|nr:hypothetical protein [Sinorhizobium meliloti]RVK90428.1 hypothetical protein CN150_27905 [Sinorhizobium meliloti]
MVWTAKSKALELTQITGHPPPAHPKVHGRAPQKRTITFTPAELYGAMARCSHLHVINPSAATPEADTCRHLLHQYVDEAGDDFAILEAADNLKDFSKTHLAGVVGAGISYLQMIRDGYIWFDHFENLAVAGPAPTKKSPDFVFSRNGDDTVALSESKATRGSSRKQFDGTVERGYVDQVAPYLGMAIGSSVASHGFSIGSWMTSATRAEILVHHTNPVSVPEKGAGDGLAPIDVRRGNYLNILSLLLGPDISRAARGGEWSARGVRFATARWLGHDWILGSSPLYRPFALPEKGMPWAAIAEELPFFFSGFHGFALEWEVARCVFLALETPGSRADPLSSIPIMGDRLISNASNFDSAIFPDGFAVIGRDANFEKVSTRTPLTQEPEAAEAPEINDALKTETFMLSGYKVSVFESESDEHEDRLEVEKTWLTE